MSACICPHVKSDRKCGNAGWLHILKPGTVPPAKVQTKPRPEPNWIPQLEALQKQTTLQKLWEWADRLSIDDPITLMKFRCSTLNNQLIAPVYDEQEKVIGLQARNQKGIKRFYKYSRAGLFMETQQTNSALVIAEGLSDTLVLSEFCRVAQVIGKTNHSAGNDMLDKWMESRFFLEVLVISDSDEVGLDGAQETVSIAKNHCDRVRLYVPKEKDIRAEKQKGLTRPDFLTRIHELSYC